MRLVRLLAVCCALMPLAGMRRRETAEKYYALGVRAMEKGDVDAAEKAFAKAAKADPSNPDYALDLQIARQHSVTKLIQDADKARLTGPSRSSPGQTRRGAWRWTPRTRRWPSISTIWQTLPDCRPTPSPQPSLLPSN